MPGYDKSRFTDVAEQDLEEYTCGICIDIYRDPVFSRCCGQTYCRECITEWLESNQSCPSDRRPLTAGDLCRPPNAMLNVLNNLLIKCDFHENGCALAVKLGDLSAHIKNCPRNPEYKCPDCGLLVEEGHNCLQNLKLQMTAMKEENDRLLEKNERLKQLQSQALFNPNNPIVDRTVRIIQSIMSGEMEQYVLEIVNSELAGEGECSMVNLMETLIDKLNAKYGRYWNCFVYKAGHAYSMIYHNSPYCILNMAQYDLRIFQANNFFAFIESSLKDLVQEWHKQ